jgi:hypothetical protein
VSTNVGKNIFMLKSFNTETTLDILHIFKEIKITFIRSDSARYTCFVYTYLIRRNYGKFITSYQSREHDIILILEQYHALVRSNV